MPSTMGARLKITAVLVPVLLSGLRLRAQPVSRHAVLAAITVLEKDITAPAAVPAAVIVTRFGRESNAVNLIVGEDTLPWLRTDVSEPEARVRALLMAAYFAGDIKSQLKKGRPGDDPYSGWLAAIRAYHQLQQKDPSLVVPAMEILIREEHAGVLRQRAADIVKQQQKEDQQQDQGNWI